MTRTARPLALLLAALAGIGLAGCASTPWTEGALGDRCPVDLVPSDEIEPGFQISQHMRFTNEEGTIRVNVMAAKRDGRLEIQGTSTLGATAVELVQSGKKIRIDDASGRFMGIHPYLLLDALHRSLFISKQGRRGDELIVEAQQPHGRSTRAFYAVDDGRVSDLGVLITFEEGNPALGAKPTTRIENKWCDYEALILTR